MPTNDPIQIPLKWVGNGEARLPQYASPGAAGLDLEADLQAPLCLQPGERALISTGIVLQIPPGFEGQIRPRSGLALRHGLTILNSPGTVDSDYRGTVGVILINLGSKPYTLQPHERIAQLLIAPVCQVQWQLTDELEQTERGSGGFGSTGRTNQPDS